MTKISFSEFKSIRKASRMAKAEKKRQNVALSKQARKIQGRPLSEPKLASVAVLRKKLEAIIHSGVKIRDKRANNGYCLTCNQYFIYSANHIIPASESLNTRYDPDNIYGGCKACNGNEKWHRSTFAQRFIVVFGAEKMMELHRRAAIKVKWGRADYAEKIEEAKRWIQGVINA